MWRLHHGVISFSRSIAAASKSAEEASAFDNVHMFSYLGKAISVAPRTANETAAVLEILNGD